MRWMEQHRFIWVLADVTVTLRMPPAPPGHPAPLPDITQGNLPAARVQPPPLLRLRVLLLQPLIAGAAHTGDRDGCTGAGITYPGSQRYLRHGSEVPGGSTWESLWLHWRQAKDTKSGQGAACLLFHSCSGCGTGIVLHAHLRVWLQMISQVKDSHLSFHSCLHTISFS